MIRRIGKRHHTERFRSNGFLVERWTNAKAGLVGYLTGKGMMATQIAKVLNDGTSPGTVRRMWKLWGLPIEETGGRRRAAVPIVLTVQQRERLYRVSAKAGLKPEEWLRQVTVCAIDDDMYESITDGRFQN